MHQKERTDNPYLIHDDVIKWKHFPRYWPFVRWIDWSPVNFPHKGQWRGALMFSLICAWMNAWVNNRVAGDLRRLRAHYEVIVMNKHDIICFSTMTSQWPPWRLKSPASRLFTQLFIRAHIKENIKAPRHWPLCGEFIVDRWSPAQMASNAENVSIWWRHHVTALESLVLPIVVTTVKQKKVQCARFQFWLGSELLDDVDCPSPTTERRADWTRS